MAFSQELVRGLLLLLYRLQLFIFCSGTSRQFEKRCYTPVLLKCCIIKLLSEVPRSLILDLFSAHGYITRSRPALS
jgi:hypothetical protein